MKNCLMIIMSWVTLSMMAGVPPVVSFQQPPPSMLTDQQQLSSVASCRIATVEAFDLDWDESTGVYVVDNTPHYMGWKTFINGDEESGVELFEGFYEQFSIPVAADYDNGVVSFETGICLDAYQYSEVDGGFRYDTNKYIYALPEAWLTGQSDESCHAITGLINGDGTVQFDGGFAYVIEIVTTKKNVSGSTVISSDTAWLLSPVLRNINVRIPNGVHSYQLVQDAHLVQTVTEASRDNMTVPGSHRSLLPKQIAPCPIDDDRIAMAWTTAQMIDRMIRDLGDQGQSLVPRPIKPGKPSDSGTVKGTTNPFGGNTMLGAGLSSGADMISDGRTPSGSGALKPFDTSLIKGFVPKRPHKPRGVISSPGNLSDGDGGSSDESDVMLSQTCDRSDFQAAVLEGDLFTPIGPNSLVPRPIKPGKPGNLEGDVSTRTSGNNTVRDGGSSNGSYMKPSSNEISITIEEPVYILQSEDGTIYVYNLYGNGIAQNFMKFQEDGSLTFPVQEIGYDFETGEAFFNCETDMITMALGNVCVVNSDCVTWGSTIPYSPELNGDSYYASSMLAFTDGSHFALPVNSVGFIKGDVNKDGNLSIADVTALIDGLLAGGNGSISINAADVNSDRNLSIADVTALIDLLLSGD